MKYKVIAVLMIAVFCLSGCAGVSELWAAEEEKIDTLEELNQAVEKALKAGQQEITFATEELQEKDLKKLNEQHDGFYGFVTRYQIKEMKWIGRTYITLDCEIGDNYYVEESILNGKEIPEGNDKAEKLKQACEKILEELNFTDAGKYKKEKKIHDYLVSHIAYGYPDSKRVDSDAYNAYGALVSGKAVCNGYAQAMKLLCDLSGVECKMIAGEADGENHAWNLIRLGGDWYHVDATWDDPEPDDTSRILYSYFNVDDEQMEKSHTWEKEEYPEAEGRKYNYYLRNDLYCEDFAAFKKKCSDMLEEDTLKNIQVMVGDYDTEIYSDNDLQFMFEYSGADYISYQAMGENPYTTIYFILKY